MISKIHPNYIKASNLIIISAVLSVISIFTSFASYSLTQKITIAIASFLLNSLVTYFVRKGYDVMKYILLLTFIFGIRANILSVIPKAETNLIIELIKLIKIGIQTWIIILLFKVPKESIDSFDKVPKRNFKHL